MHINSINNTLNKIQYNQQPTRIDKQPICKSLDVVSYSSENLKANYCPSFKNSANKREKEKFIELLYSVKVNGKPIISQIDDMELINNPSFDYDSWSNIFKFFDQDKAKMGKTALERFLSKNTIQELMSSHYFNPKDVLDVIDGINSSYAYYDSKNFFEVVDLVADVEGSKYDAIERIEAFKYFLSLEDGTGEKILDFQNSRQSKMSAYKYIMSIDPSSKDSSTIEMLLNTIEEGVVYKHILDFLPPNAKISKMVEKDIDKLYTAYMKGIDPIDEFIPNFETKEEAEKTLKIGDVFTFDGEDKCHIILDNKGNSKVLNFDKQTYFDLFPPIERFATTQSEIGNCWEISTFRALYSCPETRYIILSLFQQDGNDIKIKFKNGYYGEVVYKDSELPYEENLDAYSNGAKGFCLLENAEGKEIQAERIQKYRVYLENLKKSDLDTATQKMTKLEKLLEKGNDDIVIDCDESNPNDWKVKKYKKIRGQYTPEILCRDGGSTLDCLLRMGISNVEELLYYEINDIIHLLKEDFENNVIFWATKKNIDGNSNLTENHSYFISSANYDNNGNIIDYNVINPWGMVEQRLTIEDLTRYGSSYTYFKKSDVL